MRLAAFGTLMPPFPGLSDEGGPGLLPRCDGPMTEVPKNQWQRGQDMACQRAWFRAGRPVAALVTGHHVPSRRSGRPALGLPFLGGVRCEHERGTAIQLPGGCDHARLSSGPAPMRQLVVSSSRRAVPCATSACRRLSPKARQSRGRRWRGWWPLRPRPAPWS